MGMWVSFQMAQTYHVRPSELLLGAVGPENDYQAYCLDEAIYFFGSHIESELTKAEEKAKRPAAKISARQRVLVKYLGKESDQKSGFADPAKLL